MMNIISYYEDGAYNINIFPRKQHRPTQYYKEGNEKLLLSPGALDMAGLLITVREEDFDKIERSDIEDVYNQVSWPII
jgi:preprotein translocase subunit Sec61beta